MVQPALAGDGLSIATKLALTKDIVCKEVQHEWQGRKMSELHGGVRRDCGAARLAGDGGLGIAAKLAHTKHIVCSAETDAT